MKNPKPAGVKGSAQKPSSAGADVRKPRWETLKSIHSDRNGPPDYSFSKEDASGPSSGTVKLSAGPNLHVSNLPQSIHHPTAASSPPQSSYGFHNLERRTIVLADGTARSYFALHPDYNLESRVDKFFRPSHPQGFDPHFPPPFAPEGFRDHPPFARSGNDYRPSFGLDGPTGSSSLKRKYGEDEFAWHRQPAIQHGSPAANPARFSSGPIGDGMGREASPSLKDHLDDSRKTKQIKLGGEGYDDLPARHLRSEGNESLPRKNVDQKALKGAFLKFSKLISENPQHRKNYLEEGKNGPLQCLVCSRGSKELADVHGLIMHAYNSQNSDLLIDHLGLHKALCVLLGWNHAMAPDNAKDYQSMTADDARAIREDLIVWPPTVIIHNTSTGKRKDGRLEGLGNKEMDAKLKELGFGGGKAKSVYGKEGHLGFTSVRFSSNEIGLKEAEDLTEFFENDSRGRKDWARVQASQSTTNEDKNPDLVKVDRKTGEKSRVFYGYLATVMDIDKLELDIRKKVVIKSRSELDLSD